MEGYSLIESGKAVLGIELGSTRIKAVVVDEIGNPVMSGSFEWENQLVDGVWTYSIDDVWDGIRACYLDLKNNIIETYGVVPKSFAAIGISAMMHGYLAFDKEGTLLAPFRTWRNTITGQASKALTQAFNYNIPQRWSISHLYQSILNGEAHVKNVDYFTTLSGYVHWILTDKKVLGVGDASGMFPIDIETGDFDQNMIDKFNELVKDNNFSWELKDIMPKVLSAGEDAGVLTKAGAMLLDPSGDLAEGIKLCPPEGDAGTGMVATNSVAVRTGNISAGTSVFAMVVLEKVLSRVYPEIDLVTTPDGALVAMVHCNNCTSDINAWVSLFDEMLKSVGAEVNKNKLYETLFNKALEGDANCGGLLSYNYYSGEHVTGFDKGAPLFVRLAEDSFNLSNFMRMHLYSALASLKSGLNLLTKEEGVKVDEMFGHGGFFKTKNVGQIIASAAIDAPVSVMETAGEGGAWGIALLALYMSQIESGLMLPEFLNGVVFKDQKGSKISASKEDVDGFEAFMDRYSKGLAIERAAVDSL